MVTFFDTNVLVYFTIDQGNGRLESASKSIFFAIDDGNFFISPLILSEYIFILSKYKIEKQHQDKILFFTQYVGGAIDKNILIEAYSICENIDFCKNINDAIHLKIAEKNCDKLITFDKDFKKLQKHTNLEIEILK